MIRDNACFYCGKEMQIFKHLSLFPPKYIQVFLEEKGVGNFQCIKSFNKDKPEINGLIERVGGEIVTSFYVCVDGCAERIKDIILKVGAGIMLRTL